MPRRLADHWPAGATPMEALGYLVGAHVRPRALPHGLSLLRERAGWPSGRPEGAMALPFDPPRAYQLRSWLSGMQQHAARLGPPPGLGEVLAVLGDGVPRDERAASAAVGRAGAGPEPSACALVDLARWSGLALPFEVIAQRRPDACGEQVYVEDGAALRAVRLAARRALTRTGVLSPEAVLRAVTETGVRLPEGDPADLRLLLDVDGGSDGDCEGGTARWWWPYQTSTPLTRAMRRLRVLGAPIPLRRIPAAVARNVYRRRPEVPGEWPIPVEGVRAWVVRQPDWRLDEEERLHPVGEVPPPLPQDRLLLQALDSRDDPVLWVDLIAALRTTGLSHANAGAAVYSSPLLHRQPRGYVIVSAA